MNTQTFSSFQYPTRTILAILSLVTIALFFWLGSRYPDLDDKAMMGGAIRLQDPLSFEARYQIDASWAAWKKIFYTTINWIFTNRRGMTFGVFFGAGVLTLLRYLPKRGFKNGFANSLSGLIFGAPLGVCVNCAAPVAAGMYSGGSRAETTLSAMIASPTFNVIVLSMLIALFPVYLVVTKIALTLVVILLIVPLICRTLPENKLALQDESVTSCIIQPMEINSGKSEGFWQALKGFVSDFARDFWFIVKMTVPLMLLAGFLGATLATLIPFELFSDLPVTPFTLISAAVIGVLAPVPMGFDIILAAVLLANGTPTMIVMVLLFTLGSYSIYSHIIVSRTISATLAIYIAASIAVTGVVAGVAAGLYDNWQVRRAMDSLGVSSLMDNISSPFVSSAHASTDKQLFELSEASEGVSITAQPFAERSQNGDTLFFRQEAWHRGVDRPNKFGISSTFTPFNFAPGTTAAADIDRDGDMDLVMTYVDDKPGLMLFLNDGSGQFERSRPDLGLIDKSTVYAAVPVDIDNDGWPDLFVQTYLEGNFIVPNVEGTFSADNIQKVENRANALLTLTAGFGDLDQDGYLDAVLGNHQGTRMGRFPNTRAINRIVFNEQGKMTGERFFEHKGEPGDTLTVILTDFNMDGKLDFAEGNDFHQPDLFFFGDGTGELKKLGRDDGIIPVATETTMSLKTADFDNDGDFEILSTQIAGRADGVSDRLLLQPLSEFCSSIERADDRKACQDNVDMREWYRPGGYRLNIDNLDKCDTLGEEQGFQCKALVMRDIAVKTKNREMCKQIPDAFPRQKRSCTNYFEQIPEPKPLVYEDEIPQVIGRNVLLTPTDDGKFKEITSESGLELGGWSWDVKVFSFDNDEYQDIFIMNGFWNLQQISQSKVYMRNTGGLVFEDNTVEAGAVDYGIIASAAAADFDNDGDIDLIASSQNGPLMTFWNNSQSGNTAIVELDDGIGNRSGIGSKIWISYGENGERRQLRELQLSGGYTAFNAPYVHFGLGEFDEFSKIEIEWSTGERSELNGKFKANNKYRIERAATN